jgi:hypothetical protein
MTATPPPLKAVRKPEEHTGELMKTRVMTLSWSAFWALVLNGCFTAVLLVITMLMVMELHRQRIGLAKQTTEAASALEGVKKELVALRHVIGSQTAEDVIFLKVLILNRDVEPHLARTIAKSIHRHAQLFRRDPDFILAMIDVESNFDPNAVSSVGAEGLMQVMPQWKEQLGIMADLTDPDTSIRYGLQIYGFYDQMYADTETALQAYNRGPGAVDMDLMHGRDPTRNGYAKKIIKMWERLKTMNIEVAEDSP